MPLKALQPRLELYLKSDLSIGVLEDERRHRVNQVMIPHQVPDAPERGGRRRKYIMDDAQLPRVCFLPEVERKQIVTDQLCGLIEKSNPVQLGFNRYVSPVRALRQSVCFTIRVPSLGSRHFPCGDPDRYGVDVFESRCA